MIRRLAAPGVAAVFLLGCTTSDGTEPSSVAVETSTPSAPVSAAAYTFSIVAFGDAVRHPLIVPVPVGREALVTVSLSSLDDAVDVTLRASVEQASADGQSQVIELVVTGVEADDAATIDGLAPIIGASSTVLRDERLAVVEQELDVPAGLAFRADAVVRQALRAPFALAGPLPVEPVGEGASWSIETIDGDDISSLDVTVVSSTADGYELRFDVPDGSVEVSGRAGALLPAEQLITLDDATLRVVAERIDPTN